MTQEDVILSVRAALRGIPGAAPLRTAADAQKAAAKAGRKAGKILAAALPQIPREQVQSLVFAVVREVNLSALESARRMQLTRAEAYGEGALGVAELEFSPQRARNLAVYADGLMAEDGTLPDSGAEALTDTVENSARKCVDMAEEALADARYNMGKRAVIVRSAMGANSCPWCLSAAGEYEYGPTMDKAHAFGRHANCDCLIEYYPGTGKVETVRNYRRR